MICKILFSSLIWDDLLSSRTLLSPQVKAVPSCRRAAKVSLILSFSLKVETTDAIFLSSFFGKSPKLPPLSGSPQATTVLSVFNATKAVPVEKISTTPPSKRFFHIFTISTLPLVPPSYNRTVLLQCGECLTSRINLYNTSTKMFHYFAGITACFGSPHVTTDPSSRIAAKDDLLRISYAVRPDSDTGMFTNRARGLSFLKSPVPRLNVLNSTRIVDIPW